MVFRHRVARNRFFYFTVLILILFAFAYLVDLYEWRLFELVIIGIVFLIPGRLVQFFWRDFFKGKKLLEKGEADKALELFEGFLQSVRESPWIKWLMFFTYGLYSFKVEAVALTNIGEAYLRLGDFQKAGRRFEEALSIDSKYSVAMFMKAVLGSLTGDEEASHADFEEARRNGYPKMSYETFKSFVAENFRSA